MQTEPTQQQQESGDGEKLSPDGISEPWTSATSRLLQCVNPYIPLALNVYLGGGLFSEIWEVQQVLQTPRWRELLFGGPRKWVHHPLYWTTS